MELYRRFVRWLAREELADQERWIEMLNKQTEYLSDILNRGYACRVCLGDQIEPAPVGCGIADCCGRPCRFCDSTGIDPYMVDTLRS